MNMNRLKQRGKKTIEPKKQNANSTNHKKHLKTKETLEDLKRQYSVPSMQKFNSLAGGSSTNNRSSLLKVSSVENHKS
jgi:hypothetical protein